jgi:hypothetical protein
MIDPFTAFAMAQGAVKGIKSAMQLGRDVTSLYREFGTFFQSADAVHIASSKLKMDNVGKTDAQISDAALQIAMASKALRDSERELKDLLYWSGNAQVWEDMMKERVRMMKERNAAEAAITKLKLQKKEDLANAVMNTVLFFSVVAVLFFVAMVTFQVTTKN